MREAHRHWLWKYLGIVLSNSLRILAVLKWCLIETWTVQPFCCHKHLVSKIKKEKKKLHFYLLWELGTLLCNMCCNSEDMWVFGGLMSHDCNILGEPSLCCPGNHVTHQRSQKTAYLQHRSSTHTRQCRAACVCVCQCSEMYRRESKKSVGEGICGFSKGTFSSMASFSSPSRASTLVLIVIRGVIGGVSVYEINGRIDVVNFFS